MDQFFRVQHSLQQIARKELAKDFEYRTFDPTKEEDYEQGLEIINQSYSNMKIKKDTLKGYMKSKVYEKDLWVFIDKKNDAKNMPVAFGIAEIDASMKEGILEWIQVLPEYSGKGLGTELVNELLTRMKSKAKFVTVSGDCNNSTNPIDLYKKVGFVGDNTWYIAYKK